MIRKRIVFCLPFALTAGTIFYLSSQTDVPDLNQVFTGFDKVLHFVMYCVYGLTIQIMVCGNFPNIKKPYNYFLILILGAVFGALDEYYQSFQPGRFSDITDFLADFIGISVSLIFNKKVKRIVEILEKRLSELKKF